MVTTSVESNNQGMKNKGKKNSRLGKAKSRGGRNRKVAQKTGESMPSHLYRQGRDAISGAYDMAAKAGDYMPNLSANGKSRRQSVYAMMEERPLVMGAVGLGVGMVLATLLPSMSSHRNHR